MIGKWEKVKQIETISCGGRFEVQHDEVTLPSGERGEYWTIQKSPYVVILAINPRGEICLARQHRYPLDEFTIEFPKGNIDSGETPLEAAQRELEEEAGLISNDWLNLDIIQESIGIKNCTGHLFLAREAHPCRSARRDPADENMIETYFSTADAIRTGICSGIIVDASTIALFARAHFLNML